MELGDYVGKRVRVSCTYAKIIEGKCVVYTQDIDNIPEVASICIENDETIKNKTLFEIYENEIKRIEVID